MIPIDRKITNFPYTCVYSSGHHNLPKLIFCVLKCRNFMWVWSILIKFGKAEHVTFVVTQVEIEAISMRIVCIIIL